MSKKVKKMAFGGLGSAPTKTSLGWGKPAPIVNQPVRGPVGGGKPAPIVNQPVRGPIPNQPVKGPVVTAGPKPQMPIGGQTRPPAGNPAMMKKGGSVKSSASKRADGIATKGKTKGRIV